MSTKEELEAALKEALRSHDELRKRTLRMALSNIRMAELDRGRPLDETEVLAILQKEIKSRQESLSEAQHAGRPELAEAAQAEIGVLERYLPQPLTPDELEALAREVIAELGATSLKEMGQIMKALMPRLQGRATGDQASQTVRKLLV